MSTPETNAALEPLRRQIDQFDQQIVALLNERARVVVQIGKIKHTGSAPTYAPDREQKVLEQIRRHNHGPLSNQCLEAMWRELMSGSFALERPMRVGYLGPAGSFSHLAARRKFGACIEYHPVDEINQVFGEIARGVIDLGLVPIENTAHGGVIDTLDSFLSTNVHVCAEVLIGIHHNVLARSDAGAITRICSKPEVFSQCRKWLGTQLRDAQRVPVASSSKAAEMAAADPHTAAIASSLAAETYDLQIMHANIEDNPGNVTRFFVVGMQQPEPTGDDKTAIMFTTVHEAGALARVLDDLRDHGLNLTHIDKRPSQRVNWEYFFFVDFAGHISDPNVTQALQAARRHCLQLTVLGSFPRAIDVL